MPRISRSDTSRTSAQPQRLRAAIHGAVQGVGFRPHVYRLASELGLTGWVKNSSQGVYLEAEGEPERLKDFMLRLDSERPVHAFIQSLECSYIEPVGYSRFEVRESEPGGDKTAIVLPDIATCSDCLLELFDPNDRRYRYPFTNCTHCGPRYSIVKALPYDRNNTTMAAFALCPTCREEYVDPNDRRFHAQPNACQECGPHLELWDPGGHVLQSNDEAIAVAVDAIRQGQIVALKGIGGFQLLVDARDEKAVKRLRQRKGREEKPFAIMCSGVKAARELCVVPAVEERLLRSPESPIVLLRRKISAENKVAPSVAPGSPWLGIMLPYSPLHHLLMWELGFPVVATSGNLSEEPICISETEAIHRLEGIADLFLVHNRPIQRHVDDSVARVILGTEQITRRARGYAPLPLLVDKTLPRALAVGAHLKSTVAVSFENKIFTSQHLGDLENEETWQAFRRTADDLQKLYDFKPDCVIRDEHPDYPSSQYAERLGLPVIRVQHHVAHVFSCMADNVLKPPVLGVAWDGTGYGTDGTVWGGEFFRITENSIERIAHLKPFRLPGGEAAAREPRRSALGMLMAIENLQAHEAEDTPIMRAFSRKDLALLRSTVRKGVNAPLTSSMGRLFDGVASLIGLRHYSGFEGQAAMELEFAAEKADPDEIYNFRIVHEVPTDMNRPWVIDWTPAVREILHDLKRGDTPILIAARFHKTLAEMVAAIASWAGVENVALSGGCFQNRLLTETAVSKLRDKGFHPHWHQRIPPNDGGIAPGQIFAAAFQLENNLL